MLYVSPTIAFSIKVINCVAVQEMSMLSQVISQKSCKIPTTIVQIFGYTLNLKLKQSKPIKFVSDLFSLSTVSDLFGRQSVGKISQSLEF